MPLPNVPNIEPVTDVTSAASAVDTLQRYLQTLRRSFDNAAGNAIDPTSGGRSANSGNAALVISEAPSSIAYTPVVQTNSVNKTVAAFIDISFTLPVRAVGCEIFYRQVGETQFKQSYANESPYRLIALEPGISYEIQMAGEAANGDLGPSSQLTTVMISSANANIAPASGPYVVTEIHADLSQEHILTPDVNVTTVTVSPGIVTVGVADNGISNAKLRDSVGVSVIGRSASVAGNPADIAASMNRQLLQRQNDVLAFSGDVQSFTITGTGFTINPTGTAFYTIIGSVVTIFIPNLSGTSNAATFTLTGIPTELQPVTLTTAFGGVGHTDNTVNANAGYIRLNAVSDTWDVFRNANFLNNWTLSGTKAIITRPTFTYLLH